MSLCIIDKSLIEVSLLSRIEINWLNSYHSEVFDKLSPYLNKEESVWLKEKTGPILTL
jgi:Xaa-Pro aminopeptidase